MRRFVKMNKHMAILGVIVAAGLMVMASSAAARIKLVALPERGETSVRLDNPRATLIEEERVLTLQKGLNKVDFSWKGVSIDPDSIRLTVLSSPDKVRLLSVSYPPAEEALVWEIGSREALEAKVRISYLLSNIDRLITYKLRADRGEKKAHLSSFLVLRNFSGEDFQTARVLLDYGEAFDLGISHEETKQILFFKAGPVAVEKVWTFDAALKPWDPEKLDRNVGIPVSYRIENSQNNQLGASALWGGKVRVFQEDGHGGVIFLGEDRVGLIPVGEKLEVGIGDSRDLVVTQRRMRDRKINIRRNRDNAVVLYDTDEMIRAIVENFKDAPATLTLIEHIPGQWDMAECNMNYERRSASRIEFRIELPPRGKKTLIMQYHRRNIRP